MGYPCYGPRYPVRLISAIGLLIQLSPVHSTLLHVCLCIHTHTHTVAYTEI